MSDESFVMVDWSGGNDRGPTPKADAIWVCAARDGVSEAPIYLRNRALAERWLTERITAERAAGRTLWIGFDFPFGYPAGFAAALTGRADPLALWDWFEARVEDVPRGNNRFDLCAGINALWPAPGPFWGNGLKRDIAGLPRLKPDIRATGLAERRVVETRARGAFSVWQLSGAGAVGSQVVMGLPVLARLRRRFAGQVAVWPFEAMDRPVRLLEIWPSLFPGKPPVGMIKDAWQVQEVARRLSGMGGDALRRMLNVTAPEEGWILGVTQEERAHTDA